MIDNKEIADHQNVIDSGYQKNSEKCWMNLNDQKENLTDLEKLLEDFFDYSVYSQEVHGLQCEKCGKLSNYGYKKYFMYKPPHLLVITLKKFKKTSYFFKKSSKKIPIDETLDLTRFLLQDQQMSRKCVYELYAATHHSGSLGGGHYISYVKKNQDWFYISDSHYQKTSLSDVLGSNPYMLYYRLIQA